MTMRTTARLFSVALISLGLMTGCASTEESAEGPTAEEMIADAKAANAEAKALGHEWNPTGDLIKKAEEKLAAGDEAGAMKLAEEALAQAQAAKMQGEAENKKFLDTMAVSAASSSSSSASKGAMAAAGDGVTSYSVVKGDSLWTISGKDEVYANPYQWPLIFKTNRDKIKDADLIYPGQNFDIDQNASASEIDAAVNHAKTRGAWSVGDTEQSDIDFLNK